jgi:dynein heavy chain 2
VRHVIGCVQFLKDMQSRAQGEVTIREALQELRAWAETAEYSLLEHVSSASGKKTAIIQQWKDLFTDIGDNQSLLQSLKESQYFKPFEDQASQFEVKLAALDEYCQNLNSIQRRWVYLEPIFSRGALPGEQARFKRVDDEYRDIMGKVRHLCLLLLLLLLLYTFASQHPSNADGVSPTHCRCRCRCR